MAIMITTECINCGACEPECPNNAIYEGGAEWRFSDKTKVSGMFAKMDGTMIDGNAPQPPKAMSPKDIARIREKLNCSQAVFAMMLNISPKTVQAWEQGSREPGDAALKLLTIAKKHPEVLLEA